MEININQMSLCYWQNLLFLKSNMTKSPCLLNDLHDAHFKWLSILFSEFIQCQIHQYHRENENFFHAQIWKVITRLNFTYFYCMNPVECIQIVDFPQFPLILYNYCFLLHRLTKYIWLFLLYFLSLLTRHYKWFLKLTV